MEAERARWVACSYEAVRVGDFEGAVGEELGVPAGFVEAFVVSSAEEHEVVDPGRAASAEPVDVVAVAPGCGAVAAGEPAVAVA